MPRCQTFGQCPSSRSTRKLRFYDVYALFAKYPSRNSMLPYPGLLLGDDIRLQKHLREI